MTSEAGKSSLSSEEFDDLIKHIRVGATVAVILLGLSLYLGFIYRDTRIVALPAAARTLAIAELLIYGFCAISIYNLSRVGSTILFLFCVVKIILLPFGLTSWGALAGGLFLFVLYRSMKLTYRLQSLLQAARARQ